MWSVQDVEVVLQGEEAFVFVVLLLLQVEGGFGCAGTITVVTDDNGTMIGVVAGAVRVRAGCDDRSTGVGLFYEGCVCLLLWRWYWEWRRW